MTRHWIGLAGLLGVFAIACGSDDPPGARVGKTMALDSTLARFQDVHLLRTGTDFVLAGYEAGAVHWAHLSEDGALTAETGFALPTPVLGPYFAAVKKASPGDQLVAVVVNPGADGALQLQAYVQSQGAAEASGPLVVSSLPGGVTKEMIRVSPGVSTAGNVGLVTWGFPGQGIAPNYRFVGPDGALPGETGKISDASLAKDVVSWDCLKVTQAATPLGIVVAFPVSAAKGTYKDGAYGLERFELSEDALVSDTPMFLEAAVKSCQVTTAPTADGFAMAWKNDNGIFAGRLYNPVDGAPDATLITHMVLATTQFSSPKDIPTPVFVAAAGPDHVLGLSRETGPLVARFAYSGAQHGSQLLLPSSTGRTTPMVGWVGDGASFVTYADLARTSPFNVTKRYFLRIEYPTVL